MIENKNRNQEESRSIAVAEENRELDWKSKSFMGQLFMGGLDLQMITPYPEQDDADRRVGTEFVAKVEAFCADHVDGEAIDRAQEIPAQVLRGFAELGLFGIKIPKEYGGLGLSQTNYMRVLSVVAQHCGSCAALLSAHQSIGVPQPLKLFGTKEQKAKYLPRIAAGAITAFALTEPTVGSDPANMMTTAVPTDDGEAWMLNGEKLWCTNGTIADLYVVMARTPSKLKGDREVKQITAFIVDGRDPGIEIVHRCRFMGLRAIENGLIRFKNVRVPKEDIIWGEGMGLRLALTTLNDGRLGIPAIGAAAAESVATFSASWAKSRVQWGKTIGDHEAGAEKLANITASAYAMSALAGFCAALSDRGDTDIRMEAAAAKMFNSELSWKVLDEALQLRAGRGYETAASLQARGENAFPLERGLRDARINRIVEGTTDVMHLFLAREALDFHLRLAGGVFKRGATLGDKLGTVLKAGLWYAGWYPKLWLGSWFRDFSAIEPRLRGDMRWIEAGARRLARTLFHQMLLQGPKLEMRQLILNRLVDAGAELAVAALVVARASKDLRSGDQAVLPTARYWLAGAKQRVASLFDAVSHNTDHLARDAARAAMAAVDPLPQVEPLGFQPSPREWGEDLCSGRQPVRASEGPAHATPARRAG